MCLGIGVKLEVPGCPWSSHPSPWKWGDLENSDYLEGGGPGTSASLSTLGSMSLWWGGGASHVYPAVGTG